MFDRRKFDDLSSACGLALKGLQDVVYSQCALETCRVVLDGDSGIEAYV